MLMRPALIDPLTPLPLQQTDGFAVALRALGRRADCLPLGDMGQALVVERKFGPFGPLRFTSRGPVWRRDAMPTDRMAALLGARIHLINAPAEDDIVLRAAGYRQVMTPASMAILHLAHDPAVQLAGAHGKWRNAARQMPRHGLRISQPAPTPDRLNWLLMADALQQRRKGYRALPAALTRALVASHPADTHLFFAQKGNHIHAAQMFLRHGTAATYHIAWSDQTGRAACAHHAMILHAAAWFAQRGVTQIDLGQIDTVNAPGLARFKIGSGSQIITLGGTWLQLTGWRG